MRSLFLLAGAALAAASTIVINAGQSGLTFSPDSTSAKVDDVLEFHFFGSIHSVIQSDFANPCQSNGGFDSGTVKNTATGSGSVFQVTVTNTDPIWFFCGSPTHCQGGMAGVVNPPSSDTIADYQANAADTSSSSSASGPVGGVLVPFPFVSSSAPPKSPSSVPPPSSSPSSSALVPPPSSTPSSVLNPPPSSVPPGSPASSTSVYVEESPSAVVSAGAPQTTSPGSNATITGVPPAVSSPTVVTTSGAMSGLALLGVTRSTIVGALVALAAGALGLLL